ncbi:hypothetical protein CALCODRAFT_474079 [Calocera cornea HHB12733]|uniref:AFG1-like ATPase n=1 Tax=Calocera cornea HHB12733 TaxID=1353952 RepID=A0A165E1V4_9BASI|nr:hypothetical protein CALCODRAFT_474079 [Calocera cornea HHB12733]
MITHWSWRHAIKPLRNGALGIVRCRSLSSAAPNTGIQSTDLLDVYKGLVAQGLIQSDDEQIRVIMELRSLRKELSDYVPSPSLLPRPQLKSPDKKEKEEPWWTVKTDELAPSAESKALTRLQNHAEALANLDTPKGLLLIGPAGTGKSFLLQLFYDSLPTPHKARKHYSQLVLEIYRGVWEESKRRSADSPDLRDSVQPVRWDRALRDHWRNLVGLGRSAVSGYAGGVHRQVEPSIAHAIARRLVTSHWLLFFDEVQLLDVSSAGLLSDVLSWYWRMGGVVIGTSNKLPSDLYSNGVQRERLEPFVHALQARCPVLVMREERDWRRIRASSSGGSSWFVRTDPSAEAEFEGAVIEAAGGEEGHPEVITVFGRHLQIPWTAVGVARVSFAELCEQELGPADYISIASTFHTLAIEDVPVFPLAKKNEARRFISLLDACWECQCRVIGLAEVTPDDLFFPDSASIPTTPDSEHTNDDLLMAESFTEGLQQTIEGFRPNIAAYDGDPSQFVVREIPKEAGVMHKPLSIFTGEEERFAYARAVSRIHELSSASQSRERWIPMNRSARRWETPTLSSYQLTASPPPLPPRRRQEDPNSDFAHEAANERPTPRGVLRVEPPTIREQHVWGARDDWGKRAGEWGKGASAYEDQDGWRS